MLYYACQYFVLLYNELDAVRLNFLMFPVMKSHGSCTIGGPND